VISQYELVKMTKNDTEEKDEELLRDINDRPILRAARKAKVDIFVTGDKDFLESEIKNPLIMTATQFIKNTLY